MSCVQDLAPEIRMLSGWLAFVCGSSVQPRLHSLTLFGIRKRLVLAYLIEGGRSALCFLPQYVGFISIRHMVRLAAEKDYDEPESRVDTSQASWHRTHTQS